MGPLHVLLQTGFTNSRDIKTCQYLTMSIARKTFPRLLVLSQASKYCLSSSAPQKN